jgi:hypothetical protein
MGRRNGVRNDNAITFTWMITQEVGQAGKV